METRDKLYKSIWEEDRKACDIPLSHISDEIKETPLREVDELFGVFRPAARPQSPTAPAREDYAEIIGIC